MLFAAPLLFASLAFALPLQTTFSAHSDTENQIARAAKLLSSHQCSKSATGDEPLMQFLNNGASDSLTIVQPDMISSATLLTVLSEWSEEDLEPLPLDEVLFPGVDESVKALAVSQMLFEDGWEEFQDKWEAANAEENVDFVEIIGHGMGASIAMLKSLALLTSIDDPALKITLIQFAPPRLGNEAFAELIASHSDRLQVITVLSEEDPIPSFPPTSMGYASLIPSAQTWVSMIDGSLVRSRSLVHPKTDLSGMVLARHEGPFAGFTLAADIMCESPVHDSALGSEMEVTKMA